MRGWTKIEIRLLQSIIDRGCVDIMATPEFFVVSLIGRVLGWFTFCEFFGEIVLYSS